MRYLKTFESHSSLTIVYRGTNKKLDFIKNDMVWASEEEHEASSYGKIVYELEVDLGNCFNSLKLEDIEKLYDNGIHLRDSYYDDDEHEYDTAEDFMERGDSSDTWSSIEDSDGALGFIEGNYDSILITEGGYTNYILFNGRIVNYKEVSKVNEKFEDVEDGYYKPITLSQKEILMTDDKSGDNGMESLNDNEIRRIKRLYKDLDARITVYSEKNNAKIEIRSHDSNGLRTRDTIVKSKQEYYIVSCIYAEDNYKCDQFDGLMACLRNLIKSRYQEDISESIDNLDYYYSEISRAEFNTLTDDNQFVPYTPRELTKILKLFSIEDYRIINDSVLIIDGEYSTVNISKVSADYFIAFFAPSNKEKYRLMNEPDYVWSPSINYKCDNFDGLLQWIRDFSEKGRFLD